MRTNTDINKIKEIAKAFLYLDVNIDESFGIPILKHPIISDVIQLYTDGTKDKEGNLIPQMLDVRKEEDLDKIRGQYLELINKVDKVSDLFMLINGPYTGVFFKFTKDYMCVEDYTEFLVELWTSMEYPNVDNNVTRREFISYWKKVDTKYIYSKEDIELLDSLPEEFSIYRGLMPRAKKEALSWTLDLDKAIWFAKRFNNHGKVYEAKVKKEDILSYLSNRGESEIVVDYKKLKDIKEVEYD